MQTLEFLDKALRPLGLEIREENGCLMLERQITKRWWKFSFHTNKRELIGRIAQIDTDHNGRVYEIDLDQCVDDPQIVKKFRRVLFSEYGILTLLH